MLRSRVSLTDSATTNRGRSRYNRLMSNLSPLEKIRAAELSSEVIDPFEYAGHLVSEGIIDSDKRAETAAIVLTTPTSLFLYDGVRLFIEKILHSGSDVILWTQGDPQLQQAKCDTSGLLQLGDRAQGRIEVAAAADKITMLDGLITNDRIGEKTRIVFIDDKSTQLLRTYQDMIKLKEVEHRNIPHEIMYVWLRKDDKTKDIFPPGFPTIEKLDAFIQDGMVSTATTIEVLPVLANTLYLVDFDRTLFDTTKWFKTVQERIATEMCAT